MTTHTATAPYSYGRLATIVASRFVLNAIFRIAYPLIPFVAGRFGVSDDAAAWIVTIQVLMGLVSPVGGWLGDHIGFRRTMLLGATFVLLGTFGVALAPTLPLLIVAYGTCGLGVALYQPAVQAYVSVVTPYHLRGRAVGLVEVSWALAGFAAVPPLMWLVEWQGNFSGAFLILTACLAAAIFATLVALPEANVPAASTNTASTSSWRVIATPSVLGLLAFVFLTLGGNETMFIVQPSWATQRFAASPTDLGTALLVFGIGELGGSIASTLFTDRLGKRRAATLGFAFSAATYLLLPLLAVNWLSYLVCYFVYGLFIEFAIVSMLTFATTVSVQARATVMALAITSMQVSRAIASQAGVLLLVGTSLVPNGIVAAVLTSIGVVIALRWVHEAERPIPHEAV